MPSAVDFSRLVLPMPPDEYSSTYMRQLVARIQQLLGSRQGTGEVGLYGGIPTNLVTGTNGALNIPISAVPTKLPFNTTTVDTDTSISLDTANNRFSMPYASYLSIAVALVHDAVSVGPAYGGLPNIRAYVYAYVNGAAKALITQVLITGALIVANFNLKLAKNDLVDIRVASPVTAFNLNMTTSTLWLNRLNMDPRGGRL